MRSYKLLRRRPTPQPSAWGSCSRRGASRTGDVRRPLRDREQKLSEDDVRQTQRTLLAGSNRWTHRVRAERSLRRRWRGARLHRDPDLCGLPTGCRCNRSSALSAGSLCAGSPELGRPGEQRFRGPLWQRWPCRQRSKGLAGQRRPVRARRHTIRCSASDPMEGRSVPKQRSEPASDQKMTKAAPRFELGIKDLQSSALPLGHAAVRSAGAHWQIVSARPPGPAGRQQRTR